jgi:hypothetical protein
VDIGEPTTPKTAGTWWDPEQHKAVGETRTTGGRATRWALLVFALPSRQ